MGLLRFWFQRGACAVGLCVTASVCGHLAECNKSYANKPDDSTLRVRDQEVPAA